MEHPHHPNYLIIDASGFIYRAFHALPDLRTPDGRPTGAIFGFVKMLNAMIKRFNPEKVAVVFDPKSGQSWRHNVYSEYKANRQHMPDDLVGQIEPIKQIVEWMGLPQVVLADYEADDVIASLAKKTDQIVYIATSDKDLMQLVDERVFIAHSMTEKIIDEQGVIDKFGVKPNQVLDYLALVGDTSDNVPGVNKVGPKTAAKWLKEYHNVKFLLENAHHIKGKVGESLRSAIDQIPISQALVRLVCDCDVEWSALLHQPPQYEKLYVTYRDLNFNRMAAAIEKHVSSPQKSSTLTLTVESLTHLEQLKAQLDQTKTIFLQMPTQVDADSMIEIGLTLNDKHYILTLNHKNEFSQFKKIMHELTQNKDHILIGHDLKYQLKQLSCLHAECQLFDTQLAAYLIESHHGRYDLFSVVQQYLRVQVEEDMNIGQRAGLVHHLYQPLKQQLESLNLISLYMTVEIPVMLILGQMECLGIKIDVDQLRAQSDHLAKEMGRLESEVHQEVGYAFNLASPKQLQEVLYNTLKYPILQKTPKGQPSTSESALEQLSHQYPIVKKILAHRSLAKLKNTYTDKLPQMVDTKTHRIHGHFNQAVTSTGRLSSSEPNLQNIPIRTEEGKKVRSAFIAKPGHVLISADYSQIELRIMAHFSQDPKLIQAFNNKEDIHTATAQEVFGLSEVTSEHRRQAKAINFGLIYGMSAFGLASQLSIPRQQAQSFIDRYFERYPSVLEFMNQIRESAAETGYVKTLLGRRLYFSGINDRNYNRRQAAQRAAINAPMQGSAAEIIKLAMLRLAPFGYDLLLQVHDELVFEVPIAQQEKSAIIIEREMIEAYSLLIPLEVGVVISNTWVDKP